MAFGVLVRAAREARGWSQQELAQRVEVDRASVSNIERGRSVSVDLLRRLVDVLELDPAQALDATDHSPSPAA